jgi:hypothetical protein
MPQSYSYGGRQVEMSGVDREFLAMLPGMGLILLVSWIRVNRHGQ